MPITVDELFREEFVPAWLARKRWLERIGLEQAVTTETNYAYAKAAAASRKRIASRCDRRGNYANGSFHKNKGR